MKMLSKKQINNPSNAYKSGPYQQQTLNKDSLLYHIFTATCCLKILSIGINKFSLYFYFGNILADSE